MLDIYPGNVAPSTSISAKSPEAYATSDPTVDVMPIIPLLPSLLAPVRQAPVGSR
uniref:Photosystem II protein K n=2 Tax=Selaginella TaxID=3246 RepID=A0A482CHM9_9TRAC|nr:photosystem II protein K [Selaginella bisulcata]YP_009589415.1 photosystem II protein K [Selaginella bisulcata]YP_009589591.1 photosystem II protein K [Selaginella pennata]YP_009589638.1 photosystem II protein K [Selaginella pennata]QBL75954.1 photosystem II protein K [Selaginella bisulcata]QBL75998.1 photosystem II protein K [Selaginella bisulcata]QBL76174.1 photosystem II protein K [Selaginella pennata]QBL76221.1 photosystem II protein K [Selaginella pennata]